MTTRLLMIKQCMSTAPQDIPQPQVREHPQQGSTPVRDHPHLGTSVRQWLSAGQPRPYTAGVRSWSSSVSQTTRSNEEDLNGYRDHHGLEVDHLEEDDLNWEMELWAHHTHIMQYEKAAHDAWQQQYKTYTSLLELAECQQMALGAIAGHTDQYVEASHIWSKMLCHLDQHLRSRPGGTESMDSAEVECMCSTRAEHTRSAEHEGLDVNLADSAPIPQCTTHWFTTQEGIDAYRAQAQSDAASAQSQRMDGPPMLWLDQAAMENESDSPSRTIWLIIKEARESTKCLDPNNNIFTHAGVKIPHPESYSGEADLKKFEVFVAALLWWLSLNLLLGSDRASTLTQVRYLGNCLKGDAQEWYVWNIKHHDRVVCKWTLESALIEMQKHFLHLLMHRYTSTTYETTHQGSGTVQDLLNRLNKLTTCMVQKLDDYMQWKWFLAALWSASWGSPHMRKYHWVQPYGWSRLDCIAGQRCHVIQHECMSIQGITPSSCTSMTHALKGMGPTTMSCSTWE